MLSISVFEHAKSKKKLMNKKVFEITKIDCPLE